MIILFILAALLENGVPDEAGLSCGRRCLHGYLILNGKEADSDDLKKKVPVTSQGSTSLDLATAATEFGVSSEVVKTDYAGLVQLGRPAIAHLRKYHLEGATINSPVNGHYILILKASEDELLIVDPSIGKVTNAGLAKFKEAWSGYLIVPSQTTAKPIHASIIWLAVLILIGADQCRQVVRSRK